MRRPPAVITVLVVLAALSACNDKINDGELEGRAAAETTPELIPFASDVSDGEEGESPSIDTQDTEPPDTQPPDTEATDATDDTEAEDTQVEVDPMPGDTATFDTRPDDDPLCQAAQDVVDADEAYQKQLDKALTTSPEKPKTLQSRLKKLPIDKVRDAYDDLSAEVPQSLRRRVATIRDFTLKHGEKLMAVEDFEKLSELVAEMEGDPAASKVTKATIAVSEYTVDECGIKLTQGEE